MVGERAKNNSGDDPEIFPPDPAQLQKKNGTDPLLVRNKKILKC